MGSTCVTSIITNSLFVCVTPPPAHHQIHFINNLVNRIIPSNPNWHGRCFHCKHHWNYLDGSIFNVTGVIVSVTWRCQPSRSDDGCWEYDTKWDFAKCFNVILLVDQVSTHYVCVRMCGKLYVWRGIKNISAHRQQKGSYGVALGVGLVG